MKEIALKHDNSKENWLFNKVQITLFLTNSPKYYKQFRNYVF